MTPERDVAALLPTVADIVAATAAREPGLEGLAVAGIGWATVELERAARELGSGLGIAADAWVVGPRDALLGAKAWVGFDPGTGPAVVLLEPDTEARLAASLARFGEGVAAVYVREPVGASEGSAAEGAPARRLEPGPLGRGRLVEGGPRWGPYVVVLEASAAAGPPPTLHRSATRTVAP
jgi:hypothetical protein